MPFDSIEGGQQTVVQAATFVFAFCNLCTTLRTTRRKRVWARKWLERRNQDREVLAMLFNELGPEDPVSFNNYTRCSIEIFEELVRAVAPIIKKKNTNMREAISPRRRVAATMRFLATGNAFQDLSYSTRIAASTLSILIPETLRVIIQVLEKKVLRCPASPQEWEAVAAQFHALCQFPNCIGALDGKHIMFRPARKVGSKFRNYKGRDSIILMALVDANYKFLFVDVARNGSMHDAGFFSKSTFSNHLLSDRLGLPLPTPLPGSTEPTPYVIVGDDAFPLNPHLMKPYPGRGLNHERRIFNDRLSRAKRVVENAFGILANRFRVLLTTMNLSVEKVELITYSCIVLHNFLLEKNSDLYIPPEFRSGKGESELNGIGSFRMNHPNNEALLVREQLKTYFNGVGAVPGQEKAVEEERY